MRKQLIECSFGVGFQSSSQPAVVGGIADTEQCRGQGDHEQIGHSARHPPKGCRAGFQYFRVGGDALPGQYVERRQHRDLDGRAGQGSAEIAKRFQKRLGALVADRQEDGRTAQRAHRMCRQ